MYPPGYTLSSSIFHRAGGLDQRNVGSRARLRLSPWHPEGNRILHLSGLPHYMSLTLPDLLPKPPARSVTHRLSGNHPWIFYFRLVRCDLVLKRNRRGFDDFDNAPFHRNLRFACRKSDWNCLGWNYHVEIRSR